MVIPSARAHLLALVSLLLVVPPASAYSSNPFVQDVVPDARAEGMGRAFTAIADGPSGIWWNPGGLGLQRGWGATPFSTQIVGHPSRDADKATLRFYGLAGRVRRIGIATHFGRWEYEAGAWPRVSDSSLLLGFGVDLVELRRGEADPRLQWGVGAALRRNSIHVSAGTWPDGERHGALDEDAWDLDLGTVARLAQPILGLPSFPISPAAQGVDSSFLAGRFGLKIQNSLDRRIGPGDSPMGRVLRVGFGLEGGFIATPPLGHLLHALATFDIEKSFTEEEVPRNLKYGFEAVLLGIFAYRYGELDDHRRFTIYRPDGREVVERNYRRATHGIGIRMGGERLSVGLDYAKVDLETYSVSIHLAP